MRYISRFATSIFVIGLMIAQPAAHAQQTSDALFQNLGGKEGISKIVNDFVPIIVSDPRIMKFFETADTERLSFMLAEQFCQLSGGPCKYSGRDMRTTHKAMEINVASFNALAEDLQIAMEKNHISSAVSNQLVAKLAPMQSSIVTK